MVAMILTSLFCHALIVHSGSSSDAAPSLLDSSSVTLDDESVLLQHSLKVKRDDGHQMTVQRMVVSDENCKALITRLDALNAQDLTKSVGNDPLFPPSMASIGDGGDCGDSAAGISESCTKYNEWHPFQDYNCKDLPGSKSGKKWMDEDSNVDCAKFADYGWCSKYGKNDYGQGPANDYCCLCGGGDKNIPLKIIGPSGIQFSDIDQGKLGDCYFLAALASIAYTVPSVIDDLFVERDLWPTNVYKTKWLINGKEITVSVDNMIPGTATKIWFVPQSKTGEFWPVILEKAWAKIYGSFNKVEGGQWTQAVGALTRAPLVRYRHFEHTKEEIWNAIKTATDKKWPMGAGTSSKRDAAKYGLAEGHQYSALEAFERDGKKLVKCYNPWQSDYYNGSVANTDSSDGVFDMTLDEYHAAFDDTDIAKVMPNYKVSSMTIPSGSDGSVIDFQLSSQQPAYISVTWPGKRMVEPCPVPDPAIKLAVSKSGSLSDATYGVVVDSANTASAEISGPDKYVILAGATFPKNSWIDSVSLTVYAAEEVALVKDSALTPTQAAHAMLKFTTKDCECLKEWGFGGKTCSSFCCSPDNDPVNWCFVVDSDSCGSNWGYCKS